MDFLCPSCQKMLTVPDQYAGMLMKCPLCQSTLQLPPVLTERQPPVVVAVSSSRGVPLEKALKLRIDLVPETCWSKSLRKQARPSQWDKLRKRVYAEQGNVCRVCGASGRLSCHEVWEYDEKRLVQKLVGFHAVCSMCHHVTHFGRAQWLAAQGRLDLDSVVEHFLRVNGVGREVFEAHKAEAFRVWRERSRHQWQTDLGEWAALTEAKGADPIAGPSPPPSLVSPYREPARRSSSKTLNQSGAPTPRSVVKQLDDPQLSILGDADFGAFLWARQVRDRGEIVRLIAVLRTRYDPRQIETALNQVGRGKLP